MINGKQVVILAEETFEDSNLIKSLRIMKSTAFWRLFCPRCPKSTRRKSRSESSLRPSPDLCGSTPQFLVMADVYVIKSQPV
jgi:hypothetical protein